MKEAIVHHMPVIHEVYPYLCVRDGADPDRGRCSTGRGDQVVGAIGVSGVTAEQDGQIAQAGVKAFSASR